MSRIGKQPISIPAGIDINIKNNVVVFKKGNTTKELDTKGHVDIKVEDGKLVFSSKSDERQDRAYWGTYRALANNVIIGLTDGFEKKLEINGVGYKASVKGKVLELNLGFSHMINYDLPDGIEASVEKNVVTIKGSDKQIVGQVAAKVRGFRPPEPYKGKGVKYANERIIRKAGKTAKK